MKLIARLKKELRDQAAHMVACAVFLLPLAHWPNVVTWTFAAFGYGLTREVTEEGNPVTPAKVIYAIRRSKLDLAGWSAVGLLIGWWLA